VKKVTMEFNKKGIQYLIEDGPFDYKLIFCRHVAAENSVAVHAPTKRADP
jgi:hypothetical protein